MLLKSYNRIEHENIIREYNDNKIYGLNLCCYKINFYKNLEYYFHCYCYKINHIQL